MYSLARTGLLVLLVLVSLGLPCSQARLVENWSYERLFKESDVIVIAETTSVEDSGGTTKIKPWDVDFVGVHSTFAVKAKLKGKLDKDQLTVLHYRIEKDVTIENGPGLVSFRLKGIEGKTKEVKFGLGKPEYLLFLKHGKDDCYEPVSGHTDPCLSVREMYGAGTTNLLERVFP
jgi:hypothetical protein